MDFLEGIRNTIKQADDKELLTYLGIFGGIVCVLFGLLLYFHYSRVSWHSLKLRRLNKQRILTKKILRDSQLVKAQKKQVEEILAKDKDFRIGQAYESIIKKGNFTLKLVDQSPLTTGESISEKTEVLITSTLRGLSMKEVTDFLMLIAQVPQLYTKDITIKRTPGRSTVDIDITVATLESRIA